MGIILEGPDAAGKSSLAREIAKRTGRPLHMAGGRPKGVEEMWSMIRDQKAHSDAGHVVDRVTCISEQVYREGLFMRNDLVTEIHNLIGAPSGESALLVYCRPPDNVLFNAANHEWKPYDTEEWKQNILQNQTAFVRRYDLLMSQVPCIVYDWTSPDSAHMRDMLCSLVGDELTTSFQLLRQMQMKEGSIV